MYVRDHHWRHLFLTEHSLVYVANRKKIASATERTLLELQAPLADG